MKSKEIQVPNSRVCYSWKLDEKDKEYKLRFLEFSIFLKFDSKGWKYKLEFSDFPGPAWIAQKGQDMNDKFNYFSGLMK